VDFYKKIKDLSIIGIAEISSTGISALFWFYVAFLFEPMKYGEISFFISIATLSSTIALLGAANTMIVYTAKKVKIQTTIYTISLISGTITSIVIFSIFYKIEVSLLVLGIIAFSLVTSEFLGRKLFQKFSIHTILQRVLMIIFSFSLYFIFDESGIILGMALSYLPYFYTIFKSFKTVKFDLILIKERFEFIKMNYLYTLTKAFSGSFDKILIGSIFGFSMLGNYALSWQFFIMMSILPRIVSKYILPRTSEGIEDKKLKNISILSAFMIAILGTIFAPYTVPYFFPKFLDADIMMRIISWAVVPYTLFVIYETKFLALEQSKNLIYISITMTITNLSSILILGNIFGSVGLAISVVLSPSASVLCAYLLSRKSTSQFLK
jgi:O-antigen/teichoic acid export membrane protein